MDLRLFSPFTMLVCGASGSGKTVFTRKLLHDKNILASPPERIIWCYSVWQPEFALEHFEFHQGLPSENLIEDGNMILVIDDLMQQAKSSFIISDIFTKHSHHRDITCICLLQNLFPRGSEMRNISLNANYIVLMKNTRDRAQIRHLATQMYPGKTKFLVDSFEDATRNPFGYLLLDFRNTTSEQIRVRTGILTGDTMFAYNSTI